MAEKIKTMILLDMMENHDDDDLLLAVACGPSTTINKTFWIPAGHVKVTLSLFLERISEKYEFRALRLIKLTVFYSIYNQN
jgi:hypothetical protein